MGGGKVSPSSTSGSVDETPTTETSLSERASEAAIENTETESSSSSTTTGSATGNNTTTGTENTARDAGQSQRENTTRDVSEKGVAELEEHESVRKAESYSSDGDTPSPSEFAKQTFHEGAQSRATRAGFDGRESKLENADGRMIGGWKSVDRSDIAEKQSLGRTGGSTAGRMYRYDLTDSQTRQTNEAFVTNYSSDAVSTSGGVRTPSIENAQSQMASYAALDAMGARVPRHTFDTETKEVMVESLNRPGNNAQMLEDGISTNRANNVEKEQVKDTFAAHILVGNGDLTDDNLAVTEDGDVVAFDLDFTENWSSGDQFEHRWGSHIEKAIGKINQKRDNPLDLDTQEIIDRTEELATQLHESGMMDHVTDAASEYDDFFQDEDVSEYNGHNDPISHENRIKRHILLFSNSTSDNEAESLLGM